MSSAEHIYEKYRRADDDAGDIAWAAKLGKRAVWLPDEEQTQAELARLTLSDHEKAIAHLLRLPRRYVDMEGCGVLPTKEVRRLLRALHAAEVLETQDLDRAKALVPLEVRRAKQQVSGKPATAPKKRTKLRAQVYRPSIDDTSPANASPEPASVQPAAPAGGEAGASSDADHALEREIREAMRMHREADHFAVLGVGRDAISDEIKEAYFNLAKRFHPDRVAGHTFSNPEVIGEKVKKVFARINDAYHTLQNPAQRLQYMEELETEQATGIKSGGKVRRTEEAEIQHKKGMVFLHKKDLQSAQRMFKVAAELDNENLLHATYLAWTHYLDDGRPKGGREEEAQTRFKEILAKSPNADAAYFLGMVLKLAEKNSEAARHFEMAVALNPAHNEAKREVRLLELRRGKGRQAAAPPVKGKLLSGLDKLLKK